MRATPKTATSTVILCYDYGMTTAYADTFATWDTLTLAGIAYRVTPRHERDNWVATADDREWRQDVGDVFAYDGSRDQQTGKSIPVQRMPDEDLRGFLLEQLDHYGITLRDVNRMKS
mgnify:CR=1 FL=1